MESILLILPERVTLVVQYPPLSSCSLLNDVPVTMSHKVAGPLQPQSTSGFPGPTAPSEDAAQLFTVAWEMSCISHLPRTCSVAG